MDKFDYLPYTCVYVDASWTNFYDAAKQCVVGNPKREKLCQQLEEIWTTTNNPNHVLPCLSVRTGLDLYLSIQNFPPGSEIIMSAINIPDMCTVIHHHKLKIVSLDIDLETMSPKLDLLESLISDKTKVLLLAHIYGKGFDVEPFLNIAHKHDIHVIEDLAECFEGFDHIGHPQADLALFSFGVIKFSTAFGGAIMKIKDPVLFKQMSDLYATYPVQPHEEYLKKVLKYCFLAILLNSPTVNRYGFRLCKWVGFDVRGFIVNKLRGFPDHLMERLQHQPCTALLATMEERFRTFNPEELAKTAMKGHYVSERLPEKVTQVGNNAMKKNYWLFPCVVSNPDEVLELLNMMGVIAYRGATQLSIVEPDNGDSHLKSLKRFATRYPHEAKYLIDHVIYLPIHKHVPFADLDKMCDRLELALKICDEKNLTPVKNPIKIHSKL